MARVECPRCRGKIDPRATRCQHCQVDFTSDDLASIRRTSESGRNTWLAVLAVLVVLLALGQCFKQDADEASSAIASIENTSAGAGRALADAKAATGVVEAAEASNWNYSRNRDELRNGEIVEATIRSTNSTNLDFPYGEVHLNITIRQHPQWGKDVIFRVDEGQILCRISDCTGMINFDGKPETLSLNESGDNDSAVVFAAYAPGIIKKFQRSKKVIVELPFFQNGNRQFTFDTTGLEWPPKAPKPIASNASDVECDPKLAKSVGLSC